MRTLTVKQLIKQLKDEDPDAEVVITSDYGDHCHTEQALPIRAVEELTLRESAYSDSGWAVPGEGDEGDDEGEGRDGDKKPKVVVALRSRR